MKSLFVVWILTTFRLLNPSWWPEQIVGPAPACEDAEMSGWTATCGDTAAWRVFYDWWLTLPEPIRDQISNGF